jgi:hypothetical protein
VQVVASFLMVELFSCALAPELVWHFLTVSMQVNYQIENQQHRPPKDRDTRHW